MNTHNGGVTFGVIKGGMAVLLLATLARSISQVQVAERIDTDNFMRSERSPWLEERSAALRYEAETNSAVAIWLGAGLLLCVLGQAAVGVWGGGRGGGGGMGGQGSEAGAKSAPPPRARSSARSAPGSR